MQDSDLIQEVDPEHVVAEEVHTISSKHSVSLYDAFHLSRSSVWPQIESYTHRFRVKRRYAFLQVCTVWRDLSLATPQLWNDMPSIHWCDSVPTDGRGLRLRLL